MQNHSLVVHPSSRIVVPLPRVVDSRIHTHERPFCENWACSCHENTILIHQYCDQYVEDGLMTIAEAMRFLAGRTI